MYDLLEREFMEEEEEYEEEAERETSFLDTPWSCPHCEDVIQYGDEVAQITIKNPVLDDNGEGISLKEETCTETMNGQQIQVLAYQPTYLHLECYEDIISELKEALAEAPDALEVLMQTSASAWKRETKSSFKCLQCGDALLINETLMAARFGELDLGDDGECIEFKDMSRASELSCFGCLALICRDVAPIWDDLSLLGECNDCGVRKCWRFGQDCVCECHHE